jgi:Cu(I)/Ag(I) efflux system membrane protein CusA/SilA
MLARIIEWSARSRFIVLALAFLLAAGGTVALLQTPLEALPDLSDVQVIVQTDYEGQAPQIVEDQVTYPVASEMLKVPGAQTVRGYSFFGVSFVYVIFKDGTDLYWARSRVLENLSAIRGRLPAGAASSLGPDATGLGWIYQYVLEDTSGTRSLAELRAVQDWYLRYPLTSIEGVSEVASVGGFQKTYQVEVDPVKLRAYGIPVTRVMQAVRAGNQDVGAMMMEVSEREYMVRGLGYLRGIADVEQVVVGSTSAGTPVRVADVAYVQEAPDVRRGVADLDGRGDVVGGIVVMRFGENALATLDRVKARLAQVQAGLPPGVVIRPVYDRGGLIRDSIHTLRGALAEEFLIVVLICALFLLHVRSALVAVITLPLGVLAAFIAMRAMGLGANIMSLGGIAIAIGEMVDAAIVMVENTHKHLEQRIRLRRRETGGDADAPMHTRELPAEERRAAVLDACREVGPALFFSLLIIAVSFVPVFALGAQEGRLFKPLAWTKTLAMAAAAVLSITLVPVLLGLLVRGRIHPEDRNPVSRTLVRGYRPVIRWVLARRGPVVAAALAALVLSWIPMSRLGSEFMPPLDEGTLLYMPTTLPGIGVAQASRLLRRQDSVIASFPEVASVFGKAGRASTATDPAGLDMAETTIVLKEKHQWRRGMTTERLVAEMDSALRFPGVTNAWTMPIRGRIDMLATGIRTPVGVKLFGPDLQELERLGMEVERALHGVPGTRSAFAERAVSGYYLDVRIDRAAAARYGLNVEDVQAVIASAVGGMTITTAVEGRERYAVRLRYPHELRDRPEKLAEVLIPVARSGSASAAGGMGTMGGGAAASAGAAQIPLGQVATIRAVSGPMAVKTEDAVPTVWVYVDVAGHDLGGYVRQARRAVESAVDLPPGYTLQWSGQYEYMERARKKLMLVVPGTLLIVLLLLYLNFRGLGQTLIVMSTLPFVVVGGVVAMAALGYESSVATTIGFIALVGVAAETGIVMLVYLDQAWAARVAAGRTTPADLHAAVLDGAVERVRPKLMTVATTVIGLMPIMLGTGTGASVTRRIAAPMVGGMVSSTLLTLIVIPAVYSLWREWQLGRAAPHPTVPPEPEAAAADAGAEVEARDGVLAGV